MALVVMRLLVEAKRHRQSALKTEAGREQAKSEKSS
jgi:hypothetical protein